MFFSQGIIDTLNMTIIRLSLSMAGIIAQSQAVHIIPGLRLSTAILVLLEPPVPKCPTANDPAAPFFTALVKGASNIVSYLMGAGVIVAAIGIIIGGLMRATSFGNERRVAASNTAITCSVIGVIIVLLGAGAGNAIPSIFGIGEGACTLQKQ